MASMSVFAVNSVCGFERRLSEHDIRFFCVTYTLLFIVDEQIQEAVKLANNIDIKFGDFDKPLRISWDPSYFTSTYIDVDFVTFK